MEVLGNRVGLVQAAYGLFGLWRRCVEAVSGLHAAHQSIESTDLYELLGVSSKATQAQIRSAYLELIRTEHPDRSLAREVAEQRAAALNHAFALLSDPTSRAHYDQKRLQSRA